MSFKALPGKIRLSKNRQVGTQCAPPTGADRVKGLAYRVIDGVTDRVIRLNPGSDLRRQGKGFIYCFKSSICKLSPLLLY